MLVSIVVPCRNEKNHILPFLASLQTQELDPDVAVEVLLADGMSDDGTRQLIESSSLGGVRVIDNPDRIVSTGLNAAIDAAQGQVVLRMDVHTVYSTTYVRECLRAVYETGADSVGGPWVASGKGLIGEAIAAAFHIPFCNGGARAHAAEFEGEVDTVYLGCWPRSTFERFGRFDPQLVRNQDDEFHFRLRRQGGRVWQSPRIQSVYTPRNSLRALFRQYFQYGFWKVSVMWKHHGLAAPRQAVPAAFVGSLLLGSLTAVIAWIAGSPATAEVAGYLLCFELAAYCLALMAATLFYPGRLRPGARFLLPLVMATYHIAYGLGFLVGLISKVAGEKHLPLHRSWFTALSR